MNYNITFTADGDALQQIAAGIRKISFEIAAPLLQSMQQQVEEQNAAANASQTPAEPAESANQ